MGGIAVILRACTVAGGKGGEYQEHCQQKDQRFFREFAFVFEIFHIDLLAVIDGIRTLILYNEYSFLSIRLPNFSLLHKTITFILALRTKKISPL